MSEIQKKQHGQSTIVFDGFFHGSNGIEVQYVGRPCLAAAAAFDVVTSASDRENGNEIQREIVLYSEVPILLFGIAARAEKFTIFDVDKSEIANDVTLAQSAAPDIKKFFKTETAEFDGDGKQLLVQILKRCLEAEGYIPDLEQQRIVELGKVIGLKAKQVRAILDA